MYSYIFSPEEFENILGNLSFLKNKNNLTNLMCTLKTQLSSHMTKHFDQIIIDENLSELFTKKNALTEEDAKYILLKYFSCVNYIIIIVLFLENTLLMMIQWS